MDAINNNGNTLAELLALLITSETSDEGRARVAAEFADLNLTAEAHGDRVIVVIGGAVPGLCLGEYEITIRKTARPRTDECRWITVVGTAYPVNTPEEIAAARNAIDAAEETSNMVWIGTIDEPDLSTPSNARIFGHIACSTCTVEVNADGQCPQCGGPEECENPDCTGCAWCDLVCPECGQYDAHEGLCAGPVTEPPFDGA